MVQATARVVLLWSAGVIPCLFPQLRRSLPRAWDALTNDDSLSHSWISLSHTQNLFLASSNMTALIIGLVIAGVMTLLTSALVTVVCLMRRRRGKQADRNYNNFNNPPSVVVPTEKQ